MIIIYSFLLLASFFNEELEVLKWKEKPTIHWSDFKGKPDNSSPFDAQVYSGLQYSFSYNIVNNKSRIDFEVHSFFSPAKSWSKIDKQSDYLLKHEQVHFDISELYARKLRKAFVEHEYSKSPQKEIEEIFNKINSERKAFQKQYDHETNHSKNSDTQKKWNSLIARMLVEYADFD